MGAVRWFNSNREGVIVVALVAVATPP